MPAQSTVEVPTVSELSKMGITSPFVPLEENSELDSVVPHLIKIRRQGEASDTMPSQAPDSSQTERDQFIVGSAPLLHYLQTQHNSPLLIARLQYLTSMAQRDVDIRHFVEKPLSEEEAFARRVQIVTGLDATVRRNQQLKWENGKTSADRGKYMGVVFQVSGIKIDYCFTNKINVDFTSNLDIYALAVQVDGENGIHYILPNFPGAQEAFAKNKILFNHSIFRVNNSINMGLDLTRIYRNSFETNHILFQIRFITSALKTTIKPIFSGMTLAPETQEYLAALAKIVFYRNQDGWHPLSTNKLDIKPDNPYYSGINLLELVLLKFYEKYYCSKEVSVDLRYIYEQALSKIVIPINNKQPTALQILTTTLRGLGVPYQEIKLGKSSRELQALIAETNTNIDDSSSGTSSDTESTSDSFMGPEPITAVVSAPTTLVEPIQSSIPSIVPIVESKLVTSQKNPDLVLQAEILEANELLRSAAKEIHKLLINLSKKNGTDYKEFRTLAKYYLSFIKDMDLWNNETVDSLEKTEEAKAKTAELREKTQDFKQYYLSLKERLQAEELEKMYETINSIMQSVAESSQTTVAPSVLVPTLDLVPTAVPASAQASALAPAPVLVQVAENISPIVSPAEAANKLSSNKDDLTAQQIIEKELNGICAEVEELFGVTEIMSREFCKLKPVFEKFKQFDGQHGVLLKLLLTAEKWDRETEVTDEKKHEAKAKLSSIRREQTIYLTLFGDLKDAIFNLLKGYFTEKFEFLSGKNGIFLGDPDKLALEKIRHEYEPAVKQCRKKDINAQNCGIVRLKKLSLELDDIVIKYYTPNTKTSDGEKAAYTISVKEGAFIIWAAGAISQFAILSSILTSSSPNRHASALIAFGLGCGYSALPFAICYNAIEPKNRIYANILRFASFICAKLGIIFSIYTLVAPPASGYNIWQCLILCVVLIASIGSLQYAVLGRKEGDRLMGLYYNLLTGAASVTQVNPAAVQTLPAALPPSPRVINLAKSP